MPLPVKPLRVPPLAVTSEATKSVDVSLKVKVRVAVLPALSADTLDVMAMVGGVVSGGGP